MSKTITIPSDGSATEAQLIAGAKEVARGVPQKVIELGPESVHLIIAMNVWHAMVHAAKEAP